MFHPVREQQERPESETFVFADGTAVIVVPPTDAGSCADIAHCNGVVNADADAVVMKSIPCQFDRTDIFFALQQPRIKTACHGISEHSRA